MSDISSLFHSENDTATSGGGGVAVRDTESLMLEDLSLLEVTLSWHEAVALILELAHVVPHGSSCPDPASVAITDIGEVRVVGRATLEGSPVRGLAVILSRLIGTATAPDKLRALITQNAGDTPTHPTSEEFAHALSYFERPNRRSDIAGIHARAALVHAQANSDRELERLRAKAASEHAGPASKKTHSGFFQRFSSRLGQSALVAVLVIVLAGSSVGLISLALGPNPFVGAVETATSPSDATPASLINGAAAQASQLLQAGLAATGLGPSVSPEKPAVIDKTQPSGGRRGALRASPVVRMARASEVEAAATQMKTAAFLTPPARTRQTNDDWTVSVREITSATELATLGVEAADRAATPRFVPPGSIAASFDSSVPIFSNNDNDVEPAVLVRPQLPSATHHATRDKISVFDLVIDEGGRVEQVRLISPGNRFNDRMLVSAAKAWLFQPALYRGEPVRYRVTLRITP
jgi:hypothetical protein